MMKSLFTFLTFLFINQTIAQVRQFDLAQRIDSSSSIKHKYFQKVPAIGRRNLDSIFNEVLLIQTSLKAKQFVIEQKVKYNSSTTIKLTFYFKVPALSSLEVLSMFNDFAQIYYDHSEILDVNICRQKVREYCLFNFALDSVKVNSKFKKFNSKFKEYIENNLYYVRNMAAVSLLFQDKHINVLSIDIMNANDDENLDILIHDIRGEHIANSLTDFWLYSSVTKDFVFVEKLSTPIWGVDQKKRIFHSGWHMSAAESNAWCFKIVGDKAVKLKKCF